MQQKAPPGSRPASEKIMLHVLDVRAIWLKEFASALARITPTLGWIPEISAVGALHSRERSDSLADPKLNIRRFPLQRGFARAPVSAALRPASKINRRLAAQSQEPSRAVLVCSSPHYADVAREWPGPSVYYVTDLFAAYGEKPARIEALDRRMCAAADLVCPNSKRIAEYLISIGCSETKIVVIPNATRAENVSDSPILSPDPLPEGAADLPRPVAGVIGNLAENIDWVLMSEVIGRTPWLSWLFVGPTDMRIADRTQRQARLAVMQSGRARFTGYRPYGSLRDYARAVDVAVLPYRKREPTYSGSSTRFYEHLAACRPIVSTRGFEELLSKEPLLRLVDGTAEMVDSLEHLRESGFKDGLEQRRCDQSRGETWEARARVMLDQIGKLSL
ncbi:MAG: hypothetical protein DMF61_03800 [Blastocatellia bacterium AA13]|nr:MAG: hypothetical protein DMF61_03800 [Blastocatellia bacterium AA13]